MATRSLFKGSIKQSAAEVILIVIGVLIALWVDDWRADVAERKSVQKHLVGIVAEIDRNRWSLHQIRDYAVPDQFGALEEVIHILSQTDPIIDDPEGFVQTLIASSIRLGPWLTRSSFDSFRTSNDFHSSYIQELPVDLSGAYEAQRVLFDQRFDDADSYTNLVMKLVPARYQSETNEMRSYSPRRIQAPTIADEEPISQTVAVIVDNRTEIVRLARYKAERVTGKWYAMSRMILNFQDIQDAIVDHRSMQNVSIPDTEIARELNGVRL